MTAIKWKKMDETCSGRTERKWIALENASTIPQELRDRAMAAQRTLRNNASLPDSELRAFAKRAEVMHRDELVKAANDLLEYRKAARNLGNEERKGSFVGIPSDF